MKVNVNQKTALKAISDVLNQCEFVIDFDVNLSPRRTELYIITDKQEARFTTETEAKMISFLQELLFDAPNYKNDIERVIKVLHDVQNAIEAFPDETCDNCGKNLNAENENCPFFIDSADFEWICDDCYEKLGFQHCDECDTHYTKDDKCECKVEI